MRATLDHIVLWVGDQLRALDFYERVVGFEGVRAREFRDGTAPFPSVRVSPQSIIDLMARADAPAVDEGFRAQGASGHRVNHICVALDRTDFEALRARVEAEGGDTSVTLEHSFGARGFAPHTFYFQDPDGNVVEARYYDEA
ncbi:VOC family protein [Yinghuangia sp. ASG 101]|uniref:VOC family protein n=1 Tax=Yinghuangia sp. ASG 101 TaxID=2896848 RepID=UPI001E59CCD4|nr:VOC family protein [Yinghuangia sp. ASG 101]UGQ10357.1 VOC family protein [Yinghuangia sp. ASG 101]